MSVEQELKQLIISKYGSVRAFTLKIDMPYSTIDTIFKRGVSKAGIDNIFKICVELGISVDQLAEGRIMARIPDAVSTYDYQILYDFRCLNAKGQQAALDFMRILRGNPEMQLGVPPDKNDNDT